MLLEFSPFHLVSKLHFSTAEDNKIWSNQRLKKFFTFYNFVQILFNKLLSLFYL